LLNIHAVLTKDIEKNREFYDDICREFYVYYFQFYALTLNSQL